MDITPAYDERPIRVLLSEQHRLSEKLLKGYLLAQKNIQLAGNATKEVEIIRILNEQPVDILLLDINLPKLNALDLILAILETFPSVKIIIYSDYNKSINILRSLINIKSVSFLPRDSELNVIADAISKAMTGNSD